jgi:hypothetical protein
MSHISDTETNKPFFPGKNEQALNWFMSLLLDDGLIIKEMWPWACYLAAVLWSFRNAFRFQGQVRIGTGTRRWTWWLDGRWDSSWALLGHAEPGGDAIQMSLLSPFSRSRLSSGKALPSIVLVQSIRTVNVRPHKIPFSLFSTAWSRSNWNETERSLGYVK